MKTLLLAIMAPALLAAGFFVGSWYKDNKPAAQKKSARKVLYWVDPMHPAYKSDKPGIAPDCGMELEPVYEGGTAPVAQVAGTINVPTEKQQLIGVKYATVEAASGSETIRAAGRVVQDETKITRVHAKTEGWIYQTHVDFTGQLVKAGDPLLTIYSPEMLATEQELLVALRARDLMKNSTSREAYENSVVLVEATRQRLGLWDLSAKQMDEIERTRKTIRAVTLYSPATGYVVSRNAFPSQRITPETELYALSDRSRVWVMADVFEADMAKIHVGQTAVVSQPYGGMKLNATVTYIQPQVDAATRTLKVRLEAANANLRLKPDMFVDVEFRIGVGGRMTVPADAVVDTGLRKTVFVDRGNGDLEPREVETGDRVGDRIQIVRGLKGGERVVASGAFLIDSEAQLKNGGGK